MSDDELAWPGDAFAEFSPADATPWVYVAVVMPMAGLDALLKVLAGLGFTDGPDWCEMRRRADSALVDYGPCPPPWKAKAQADG